MKTQTRTEEEENMADFYFNVLHLPTLYNNLQ